MKRIEIDEDCLQVDSNVARIIKKVISMLISEKLVILSLIYVFENY